MYFPYFRGKQYELITVREQATLMAKRKFVPIIEPVKESLSGLQRAVEAVHEAGGRYILIVNPYHGDHSPDAAKLQEYGDAMVGRAGASMGILLMDGVAVDDVLELNERYKGQRVALIHMGFPEPRQLASELGKEVGELTHVFVEDRCSKLYRRRFVSDERVLVRDGFRRLPNREYADVETFSDLHVTFEDEGAEAFGDFLIVGNDYSESGGPAYAVAIHLTFIDHEYDDELRMYHFKSDRSSTPQDPAGKFAEALKKLVDEVEREESPILRTTAVREFLELHHKEHFPGLGSVKRLSMNHHIETLADYFKG